MTPQGIQGASLSHKDRVFYAAVLVDCPGIEDLLTYKIPPDIPVTIGDIVTVPLSKRIVSGIVMEISPWAEEMGVEFRPLYSCVSTSALPAYYWNLLQKTADYYRTPLLQTARVAFPPGLIDQSQDRVKLSGLPLPATISTAATIVGNMLLPYGKKGVSRRFLLQKVPPEAHGGLRELQKLGLVTLYIAPPKTVQARTTTIVTLGQNPSTPLSPRQAEILSVLERLGGESPRGTLLKEARTTVATLHQLEQLGHIALRQQEVLRFGSMSSPVPDREKALNPDQQSALTQILGFLQGGIPQEILLYGVTGSGKTEVYLQAIAPVLNQGKSALVLVPEIGLTPQLTDRFCRRFGSDRVLIYHSHLSDGERFDTWRYLLTGEPRVVVGTRSAVFLPFLNLGMIILDEEHDGSFKQDQPQPCYHARTIAQWRKEIDRCPLILGSATPAAESLWAGEQQHLTCLSLPQRIGGKPLPPITIVDMREEFGRGNRSLFSQALQSALITMQEQQKQGILFVPRRGHSTFVSCRNCGYVVMCPHCDVSLSYHLTPPIGDLKAGQMICHYCNFRQIPPPECPQCSSKAFRHFGSGTQRVVQELTTLFPHLRLIRFDSDTTRNKNQHRDLLEQFQHGKADLLVGTQMITKGIDIPQVTLVGVLAADGLFHLSDYRAGERAFQVLQQVAGRAGRGEDPGQVVIQTYAPDHSVIQAVKNYEYSSFMQTELQQRQLFGYPPFAQMAMVLLSSPMEERVAQAAADLGQYLNTLSDRWQVLGPAPANIFKVANRYRWQLMVKFPFAELGLMPTLSRLRQQVNDKHIRITIDIDPLTIL